MVATRRLHPRTAMLVGLALLVPGLGPVVLAGVLASLALFVAATAFVAIGFGLGYRGSIQILNVLAAGAATLGARLLPASG